MLAKHTVECDHYSLGLLNMSNILCVTTNPPPMFTLEMKAAMAAREVMVLSGVYPPPMSSIPPTAVMPEMALVTDMRGECRAGVTPHTV